MLGEKLDQLLRPLLAKYCLQKEPCQNLKSLLKVVGRLQELMFSSWGKISR